MSIHTLQDLAYAYRVADPVREMLFALQDRIDALEAQRKPLSDAQITQFLEAADLKCPGADISIGWLHHFIKSIEAAHGIKEGT